MTVMQLIVDLMGLIISWPVAFIVTVFFLREPLRTLLGRLSEAEGFGVKANFQELTSAVNRIELRNDLQELSKSGDTLSENGRPDDEAAPNRDADAESAERGRTATEIRFSSALQQAQLNPGAAIQQAQNQLRERIQDWYRRYHVLRGIRPDRSANFSHKVSILELCGWISGDLHLSLENADALGTSLISQGRRKITESQALSYLTLIVRLERLLEDEARPNFSKATTGSNASEKPREDRIEGAG